MTRAPSRSRSRPGRPLRRGRPAAALSVRAWLGHLVRHVPVAIAGEDPEGVHQVRVAAGRLAVWLEMAGHAVLRDDLRDVRASAAAVRDCDVLLLRGVPEPFAERLRERREGARESMLARLRSPHFRALRLAFSLLPPLDRRTAAASVARFRERVLRRGDALAGHERPADEDFHRVRRAVRKLRYALEWLGEDVKQVKAMQQVYGDLNDLAVESALLAATGAAADLPRHARTLRLVISAKRRTAHRVWREARQVVAGAAAP